MSKFCWYILCVAVIFTSCRRNNDDGVIPGNEEPPKNEPFSFVIEGVHDTMVEQKGDASVLLLVKYRDGEREPVTLEAIDLPKGITVTISPDNAKKPPFNTFAYIHANRAEVGTYPIKIKASSFTATSDTVININLQVKPYSNPARALEGEWAETGNCTSSGAVNNNFCTISVKAMNEIEINGVTTSNYTVVADINPTNNTLIIPKQHVNSIDIEGTGTYTEDKITISYSMTGVTINQTCSSVFNLK